ncbi:MAG: dihydrodipicolinate synthase family protein [Candidatus Omnitrophica bacterium]|nr:dihydrodipicolinate synthase family protein [Candidatus Omnitrophota bacterium]
MDFDTEKLHGVCVPIVTPLIQGEGIDKKGTRRLTRYLLKAGVHSILALGGMGEFPCLNAEQRKSLLEAVVNEVNGRIPVIACVGDCSAAKILQNARAARIIGADVLISPPPFPAVYAQEELFDLYAELAEKAKLPVMLYNYPDMFKNDIHISMVKRLSRYPGIVGMKESSEITRLQNVVAHTRKQGFRVFCGKEYFFCSALLVGARGGTPTPANIIPHIYVKIYEEARKGNIEEAQRLQDESNKFVWEIEELGDWISVVKAGLKFMGICGDLVMRPRRKLSGHQKEILKKYLQKYVDMR